ncbi:ABC-F family ATP-binding cassette domain-containing protein [Eubacteriales bacterium DFI.9.88]|nr:ABC-F family ATP-binding cassette domain-containing protein [Eubacteriales bacterium DFI.9.88]
MVLLTCEHIQKSYTEKPLITDVNLTISDTDKIGFVGVNGTGKSTLLKIVSGALEPEGGTLIKSRELMIGYLPQNPDFDGSMTVLEQASFYVRRAEAKNGPGREKTEEYQIKAMLGKLGMQDTELKMNTLSGGQRKRVAMAAVLAQKSNLLILDEPTNHMDNEMIEWMEGFLKKYKGAIFMITHDRYFLDRVTNRIVEMDKGRLYSCEGNYNAYLEAKAARQEMELASERKRAAIYKKELAWIRRGAQARSTKAKGRIQRFEELKEAKLELDDSSLELSAVSSRLGKKIIELSDISKSYGDKTLIRDFSYTVLRNDRIGIIGLNGCGKSTLLKIIMGQAEPDGGRVEMGDTVKIGYFSQENEALDEDKRIIQFIGEIAGSVRTEEGIFSASQMLERFLFPPHMHSVKVGALSGGEKRRLYLLSILMQAPNILVFDEPTNDLDIDTLTVLEDYLDGFSGAVILVSHDRYFLDRLAVRTFVFEGEGKIGHYPGGYTDWLMREKPLKKSEAKEERPKARPQPEKKKKLKFSYKEQREYDSIEDDISKLEEGIAEVQRQMAANATNSGELARLDKEQQELEEQLLEKMERWEYLSELAEKIENQRTE